MWAARDSDYSTVVSNTVCILWFLLFVTSENVCTCIWLFICTVSIVLRPTLSQYLTQQVHNCLMHINPKGGCWYKNQIFCRPASTSLWYDHPHPFCLFVWFSLSVKVFSKCIFSLLYLPAVFTDRSIHHWTVFGLSFLSCFLHPTAQCFVCLGRVVCAVLPSSFSSLPSPLLSSLLQTSLGCSWFVFALLPEFRLQRQKLSFPSGCLCFRPGRQCMIRTDPPSRLNRNADWMSSSCVCSSPPPAAHKQHAHIHTPHVHMHVSSQADTFTLGGLLASFSHFFVCRLLPLGLLSACTEPLFCLSVCYQSLSLSPFTFLPCSDVSPVFHFIHASCSSLINNQMTSLVSFFSPVFECQIMICTCKLLPTSSLLFPVYFLDILLLSHKFELVLWFDCGSILISTYPSRFVTQKLVVYQEEMALFLNQLLLSVLYAESIGLCAQSPHVHVLCQTVWIKMCFVIPHTVAFWWSVPFCFINPPTQAR